MRAVADFVVVDASLSLKWVLNDEDFVTQAVALRNDAIRRGLRLVAPSQWLYEMTNGLVVAVRRHRISSRQGEWGLRQVIAFGVEFADPDVPEVYSDALRFGIGAYDAAYVTLARALDVVLWTGDRRLYETIRDVATSVRWVGSYGSSA